MGDVNTNDVRRAASFDEGKDYAVSKFRTTDEKGRVTGELDNYECLHCQYSSTDPKLIKAHLAEGEHVYGGPRSAENLNPGPMFGGRLGEI